MPGTGVELFGLKTSKSQIPKSGGAKSGALEDYFYKKYPDLTRLIQAWPELPEHIKAAIKALIQTYKAEGEDDGKQ